MNYKIAATALIAIGTAQLAGDLVGMPALKALGAASHASPAPKVFTALDGLETFSASFYIEWNDIQGERRVVHLTPQNYARIKGPYNRRNPYGATIAYSPQLASDPRLRPVLDQVSGYAFCGKAPLLRELGISPEQIAYPLHLRLEPRADQQGLAKWQTEFVVSCEIKHS